MSLARTLLHAALDTRWSTSLDPLLRRAAVAATAARAKAMGSSARGASSRAALDALYARGPLLLGHRGAKARAPENTLGAFRAALDDGAHGVELDTTLSGDSVPIVLHDDTLDRTTNGRGKPTDHDADDLAALDAGSWFPGWGKEPVPRLDEMFRAMPDGAVVNVEIKGPSPAFVSLERRVVDVIRAHWPRVQVIVSSFHPAQLLEVRRLAPELPIGLLFADDALLPLRTAWTAPLLVPDALHPPASAVTPSLVHACRRAGIRLNVWAVRDEHEAARLLAFGVDGLIVDDVASCAPLFER
ncbi:MAG: glycerophosphodiester phosphodiesterase [Deltaproteobacteria bacterium]|nr:glycerophosphodiester phosphodiesterase [Deltaproteobacteria bacterium]